MTQPTGEKRDLVLAPGEYAFLQDETRGQIKVHVGPTVINQTAQDRPVVYNPVTKNFQRCGLEQAVVKCPVASEGDYVVVENPANGNQFPEEGGAKVAPALRTGRKVNIPGPCAFGLWPTQKATVIPGHHLRSNQYLLVRVYNEEEAKQNWNKTVAVLTNTGDTGEQPATAPAITAAPDDLKLTIGKLLIIKGTEVSFYIPPTGVEVVPDERGQYVREAVTLERLEYCILIAESGNRRYERGPQVVFPAPTEQFYTEGGVRKYRAIELNGIQGIHVKVVAPYSEVSTAYDLGTELFITGEDTPIYYPRVEHSIIRYGDKQKHYATAVPAGEGRYVMDRNSGEIRTERGPKMLLPDPRTRVIVRRILSDRQCILWYPGNEEALAYNRSLREIAKESPSNRSGFVSEGDIEKVAAPRARGAAGRPLAIKGSMQQAFPAGPHNVAGLEGLGAAEGIEESLSLADQPVGSAVAETFERGTQYNPPRTVTLDTKYDGVPSVTIWTGYAVMVVSKTGSRRVVVGPQTILLEYDESLEVLELSTGKPKTTDKLEKTVYLRTKNNKVSDIVTVTTRDHVNVSLKLSYRINFEADDPNLWFQVENYVKFLCDHCRSILKGVGQKKKVEDFYTGGVDIVRDALLGTPEGSRPGLVFEDNGMRLTEVEVLGISVEDEAISKLLHNASHQVVAQNINLHQAEKELEVTRRKEEIKQETERSQWTTQALKSKIDGERLEVTKQLHLARIASEKEQATHQRDADEAKEAVLDLSNQRSLARQWAEAEQAVQVEQAKANVVIAKEEALTRNVCERFRAASGGFTEAIAVLQNQETLVKVAQAMSVQHFVGGATLTDVIIKVFQGTGLEDLMKRVDERANNGAALAAAGRK